MGRARPGARPRRQIPMSAAAQSGVMDDVRPSVGPKIPGQRFAARVLAAVVVPPHLSVSGGARAAEQLTAALAPHCAITIASMMNGDGAGTDSFVSAAARRRPVRSWLPPLLP